MAFYEIADSTSRSIYPILYNSLFWTKNNEKPKAFRNENGSDDL